MAAWEKAWSLSKDNQDPAAKAVADKALGELAKMNARLGRFGRLKLLFAEMGDRNVQGSATEKISGAKAGLWLMENRPEVAFRCGPMALSSIQSVMNPKLPTSDLLFLSRSTQKGMSLTEIQDLGQKLQMGFQMAKRNPGASVVLPSVIHWKVDHYAALIKQQGNQFLLRDPTFGEELWITKEAIDAEGSGYFLIPKGTLPPGWKSVGTAEGNGVFGKGNTGSSDPNGTGSGDGKSGGNQGGEGEDGDGGGEGCGPSGMPKYAFHSMLASLNLEDIPVGTASPRGPNALFKVTYNQREANQPATFSFSNLGQKWTFDWLSYIEDDPLNLSADVSRYLPGGGLVYFKKFQSSTQSFAPERKSGSILVRISGNPIVYERRLKGGGREIYSESDGLSTFPRKVFLKKIFNIAGDSLVFSYDHLMRLISAQDALGQVTTISYELGSDSLKITKVTDPFGRYASFAYNSSGQLESIMDVLGLETDFTYGSGDFIDTMKTPYGNTVFSKGESGTNRWIEALDPIGQRERLEYKDMASGIPFSEPSAPNSGMITDNRYIYYRNSFFWDKKAMQFNAGDYTKAKIYHWLHTEDFNSTGTSLESEKKPLENRVWYNYTNQYNVKGMTDSMSAGPTKIGRVLDDGSTQIFQREFNARGHITKLVDPLGRETRFLYDSNQIDLISIRQKNGTTTDLLDTTTYNSIHLPLTIRDAAGQMTTLTYNSHGQMLTYRNPKGETTSFTYDSSGYLLRRQGALSGDTTRYTYDGFGRVRTHSGPDGYTLRFDYDAMDRVTKISYPDSTYEQFVYHNLDMEKSRDRRGRWSKIFRNALQQPVAFQDPLLRITNFEWCGCGEIKSLTDPEGRKTLWKRDLQGRVTDKVYADGKTDRYAYETTTSRLLSRTDAKGQVSQYQYFKDNALKQVGYANAAIATSPVAFTYDSVYVRVSTMTDGVGTTGYAYKPVPSLGALRLDSLDGPWPNDVVAYTYDSLGRVLTLSINGVLSSVEYDSLGRAITAGNALGNFTYSYIDQTSRLDSVSFPNGQGTHFDYFNNAGDFRLKEIKNRNPALAILSKFNYTYDSEGQIRSWTRQVESQTPTVYSYSNDVADQLLAATLKNSLSGAILKSLSYSYDKSGNRNSDQVDSITHQYSYNNLNQLLASQGGGKIRVEGGLGEAGTLNINGKAVPIASDSTFSAMVDVVADTNLVTLISRDFSDNADTVQYRVVLPNTGSRTYAYDLNGNMTTDGIHGFEYDSENRLVAIVKGTLRSEFQYDGYDRRVQIVEKNNDTVVSSKKFLWVSDAIAEERDTTGGVVIKGYFSQGMKTASAKFFYTHDHLGSIREMTDSTGSVVARYDYDPFGTRETISETQVADFGFTGHYFHSPSGLYLAKFRGYNPEIGRWISRDPIGEADDINLFAYVGNDPINYSDPLGLNRWSSQFKCPGSTGEGFGGGRPGGGYGGGGAKGAGGAGAGKPPSVAPKPPTPPKSDPAQKPPKRSKNHLPDEGPPNTTVSNKPNTTVKKYGSDGKTTKEGNKGHSGNNVPPVEKGNHIHDYTPNPNHPSGKPTREPGRAPEPGEWEELFP